MPANKRKKKNEENNSLRDTFGILRDWKADAQKMKDRARRDWDK